MNRDRERGRRKMERRMEGREVWATGGKGDRHILILSHF